MGQANYPDIGGHLGLTSPVYPFTDLTVVGDGFQIYAGVRSHVAVGIGQTEVSSSSVAFSFESSALFDNPRRNSPSLSGIGRHV